MLTKEQAKDFLLDRTNPTRFIENKVKISHPSLGILPFNLYKFQKGIVNRFISDHNLIMLKSRQVGASTIAQAIALWSAIHFEDYKILIISAGQRNAKSFLAKIKNMFDNLPDYLKEELRFIDDETSINKGRLVNNKFEMHFSNGSSITALPATESASRGESINLLIIDEAAFIERVEEVYKAIFPTLSKAMNPSSKKPYGIVVVSTPNGIGATGAWYYNMYTGAICKKNSFTALKVHWKEIPEYDENWYKMQCESLNWDVKSIAQELDLSFVASGNTYIPAPLLSRIGIVEPIFKSPDETLWIWEKPKKDTEYILGVDVGYGVGSDDSVIQVIKANTLEQVAEYACNTIIVDEFAKKVIELSAYYNYGYTNVERNALGKILIDKLLKLDHYRKMRLFKDVKPAQLNNLLDNIKIYKKRKQKIKETDYGTLLTGQSRDIILSNMYNIIVEKYVDDITGNTLTAEQKFDALKNGIDKIKKIYGIIKSERLLNQFLMFTVDNYNRPSGSSDDMVLAYTHSLWCYTKTKRDSLKNQAAAALNVTYVDTITEEKIINHKMSLNKKFGNFQKFNLTDDELMEIMRELPDNKPKEENKEENKTKVNRWEAVMAVFFPN